MSATSVHPRKLRHHPLSVLNLGQERCMAITRLLEKSIQSATNAKLDIVTRRKIQEMSVTTRYKQQSASDVAIRSTATLYNRANEIGECVLSSEPVKNGGCKATSGRLYLDGRAFINNLSAEVQGPGRAWSIPRRDACMTHWELEKTAIQLDFGHGIVRPDNGRGQILEVYCQSETTILQNIFFDMVNESEFRARFLVNYIRSHEKCFFENGFGFTIGRGRSFDARAELNLTATDPTQSRNRQNRAELC
ncbi:hypothetical protein C8R43DRAFT_949964 [Mycena crocata]|nr:hypothetical protein C8R43DRAFT_949964 [Mycena crocata]